MDESRDTDAAMKSPLSGQPKVGVPHVWTISHAGDGYVIAHATKTAQLPHAPTVAHARVPEPQRPVLRTRGQAAAAQHAAAVKTVQYRIPIQSTRGQPMDCKRSVRGRSVQSLLVVRDGD